MAGVVLHGPPMTLRSRGELICTQMRRHPIFAHLHTHARRHAVPWHLVSSLGISKPHEIIPGATIYAIFPSLELNRATGTGPFPSSPLLSPAPRLDGPLPQFLHTLQTVYYLEQSPLTLSLVYAFSPCTSSFLL